VVIEKKKRYRWYHKGVIVPGKWR